MSMREHTSRQSCVTAAAAFAVLWFATAVPAVIARQERAGIAGRWEFTYDAPAPSRAGGPGRAGPAAPEPLAKAGESAGRRGQSAAAAGQGAQAATTVRRVILDLNTGPGSTLTGTLGIMAGGRNAAPGNNPLRPVEIRDGTVTGNHASFTAWQFDGYRNRVRYEGTVDGDVLRLTMTRDTAAGPEKIEVTASRLPH